MLLVFLAAVLFLPRSGWSQAVYGTIVGTITDASGAAVPNADVTVTNVAKGVSVTAKTDAQGEYSIPHLIPDVYRVRAESPGFAAQEVTNVRVYADTTPRVSLSLQPATQTQAVTVTEAPPLLQADRADVSTILNERALQNLPNFNRNFTAFELLTPGTSYLGWGVGEANNPQRSQQIELNGQLPFATGYELDGTDNQEPVNGIAVINPNLDAVSEMKVTAQNYDAEFGKAVAGLVTAQTKSGGNEFHGSAFEFRRSDEQQARDPFQQYAPNPLTGRYIPSNLHNQFGGSVGGPVLKDKLFFFADYQGLREKTGTSFRTTVPTLAAKSSCTSGGDCNLSGYPYQVFDPASNPTSAIGRSAFAGNIIPASRLSAPAINLLKLIPDPNTGLPTDTTNNYIASGTGSFNTNQFDVRVDSPLTQKLHLFTRITRFDSDLAGNPIFGAAGGPGFANGFAGTNSSTDYSLAAGGDYVLTPSWVTDFRFGWYQVHVDQAGPGYNQALGNQLGIPNTNVGDLSLNGGLPQFNIEIPSNGANGSNVVSYGTTTNPSLFDRNNFQFVNNWSHPISTHNIKFGGDIRYSFNHIVATQNNNLRSGLYNFQSTTTSGGPSQADLSPGVGLATFLLGDISSFSRSQTFSTSAAERQTLFFTYVQDQWRITPKLTFNYGLRWEQYYPEYVNGKGNGGLLDLNTGVVRIAGYGPWDNSLNVEKSWTNLAPRAGLAWQVTSKDVLRAGYGRVYGQGWSGNTVGLVLTASYPIQYVQQVNPTTSVAPIPFQLQTGPPAAIAPVIPQNGSFVLPDGIQESTRPTSVRLPTVDSWNVAWQRAFRGDISVQVQYVGSHSIHNMFDSSNQADPNQPTLAGFNTCPSDGPITFTATCTQQSINPLTGKPYTLNDRKPYYNGSAQQLGAPGAAFGWTQSFRYNANLATARYNALQVVVSKQFSHGLQFLSHYTYSKSSTYESNYFFIDRRVNYGPSYYNKDHAFIFTGNYDLPFGRGRAFGNSVSGWLNQVIGGWTLNGTVTATSGYRYTPGYANCGQDQDVGGICHLNHVSGDTNLGAGSFDPVLHRVKYFDSASHALANGESFGPYQRPQPGTFGNWERNALTGPGYLNTDVSVAKNFRFTEAVRLQLRVEAFNVFNKLNLGQPDSCIDCQDGNAGYIFNTVSSQDGTSMRRLQFAARIEF